MPLTFGGGQYPGIAPSPVDHFAAYEAGVYENIAALKRSRLNNHQRRQIEAAEAEMRQMVDLRLSIQARIKPLMPLIQNMPRVFSR